MAGKNAGPRLVGTITHESVGTCESAKGRDYGVEIMTQTASSLGNYHPNSVSGASSKASVPIRVTGNPFFDI